VPGAHQVGSSIAFRTSAFVGLSASLWVLVGVFSTEKLSFLYKDTLHLTAGEVATLGILIGVPGYLRVIMGAGADLFPFLGYHRRSYYALSWLLMAAAMFSMATVAAYSLATVVLLVIVYASGSNLLFVIMDAVMVRVGNETGTIGQLQSIQQGVQLLLGVTFAGPLAGFATQHWSYKTCFLAAGACALIGAVLVGLIAEPSRFTSVTTDHRQLWKNERRETTTTLLKTFRGAGLWALIAYIFYLVITPGSDLAQFYYSVDVLHLSKQTIGNLRIPGSLGALIAMAGFALASPHISIRAMVWGAFSADCAGYLVSFALADGRSAYLVAFCLGFTGYVYTLSLITLGARACPAGIEAAVYGLVNGAMSLGGTISNKIGSTIYDAFGPMHGHSLTNGWHATLWSGLALSLAGIVFIPFLPSWTRSSEPLRSLRSVER
jgi:MFS family permease